MSFFILPPFSKNVPNKIGEGIEVYGKNTLMKTTESGWNFADWRVAVANEPIDAKVDGTKMFCVRVDDLGRDSFIQVGFTPMDTFDSSMNAHFGFNGFTGC